MSNAPLVKVSVVLCTFNGAAFLEAQLRSILCQSYPLHEIVVVDDRSSDGTVALLQSFAAQNPLIRIFQNTQTLGYNKNFEKALSLATGEVLAIADQDDLWHPQKIEILLREWKAPAPLIYCNSALFSGNSPQAAQPSRLMRRFSGCDPRRLAVYNTVSGHALLLKKSLLQLALPFNPEVYYDWWLAVVAASNGGVQFHAQVLVYQRWHGENASRSRGHTAAERHRQEKEMVLRHLEQFRKTPGMNTAQKNFFEELYQLWRDALQGINRKLLFLFLLRHRQLIYSSKVRNAAFLSQLKRSYRYAFK